MFETSENEGSRAFSNSRHKYAPHLGEEAKRLEMVCTPVSALSTFDVRTRDPNLLLSRETFALRVAQRPLLTPLKFSDHS